MPRKDVEKSIFHSISLEPLDIADALALSSGPWKPLVILSPEGSDISPTRYPNLVKWKTSRRNQTGRRSLSSPTPGSVLSSSDKIRPSQTPLGLSPPFLPHLSNQLQRKPVLQYLLSANFMELTSYTH
ncbi:hypothetical protein CEXT_408371 [Caerostris extrusa]|uniref:Uncharacterized protein n=1 Tax=Caerostris extrusa TaxID=172846 RepID=A0AAV4SCX0_CAEEX|nr:hypothetical protein CEXT_408371 [Caerostris extrusa]